MFTTLSVLGSHPHPYNHTFQPTFSPILPIILSCSDVIIAHTHTVLYVLHGESAQRLSLFHISWNLVLNRFFFMENRWEFHSEGLWNSLGFSNVFASNFRLCPKFLWVSLLPYYTYFYPVYFHALLWTRGLILLLISPSMAMKMASAGT
jgi:hypothetical protein